MCLKDVRFFHPAARFRLGKELAQKVTKLVDSGKELIGNEIARTSPILGKCSSIRWYYVVEI